MKILITGASGYIGKSLVKIAAAHNHQIVGASRRPMESVSLWFPFDLDSSSELTLPEDIDAVIHLASHTSAADKNNKQNEPEVAAACALITAAHKIGAKFIFVSSQTAREKAPTTYGRTKWHIEQDVLAANGLVVRLGQVYGGPEQGLFGTLVNLVRRLRVLPAFVPSPLVQPIHIDDCAEGLLRYIELKEMDSGVYCLASPEPISFATFLKSIARNRVRGQRLFVPVPTLLIKIMTNILGSELTAKHGLHRMNSLFDLSPMDTATDLCTIGLELRSLHSGMHRSGSDRRRRLIREGTALLTYLLKDKPTSQLLRRYVYMVEKVRGGTPLDLPSWLLQWPVTFALLDDRSSGNSPQLNELDWRLDAAMVLAEASVQGAVRFLGPVRSTKQYLAIIRMAAAVGLELLWRLLRFIFPSSILHASLRRKV
jgi:nucleoside-diphosphate-sugar epimerase